MFRFVKNIFHTVDIGEVIRYALGIISILILIAFFVGVSSGMIVFV